MRLIPETRSIQVFVDDLVYLSARLKSEAEVAELAGPVETMIAEGRKRRDELEQARQKVLVASARRVAEDQRLDDALMALGRAALDASGGRRDSEPYRRLFARSPSELAALSLGAELEEVRRLEAELAVVGGPLAERAAPLAELRTRTETALREHADAEIVLGRARTEARLFKQECNRARQRIEGALLQRLAVPRRRIATFFKPAAEAGESDDAALDTPVPAPAPAPQ